MLALLLRLIGLARDGCVYERPLRNPRRRQDGFGRRDPRRLSKAGQEAAPGPQSGRQAGGGAVQGGRRRQRSAFRPGEAAALRRRRDRRLGSGEGAAQRPILSRLRRRGRPSLRGPGSLRRLRAGRRSFRGTAAPQRRAGAAPAGRGPALRASGRFPRRGERREQDHHPAARRDAECDDSRRRRGRADLEAARQGRAEPGRGPAGRRAGADRGQAAPLFHPRRRRHPARSADHGERGGAGGGSQNADDHGKRHAQNPEAIEHRRCAAPPGQGSEDARLARATNWSSSK